MHTWYKVVKYPLTTKWQQYNLRVDDGLETLETNHSLPGEVGGMAVELVRLE